ncbi:hypothetical protein EO98_18600 [Methanosarcina sp. 2.H.T.1A.6]|uniref:hypothetical protein n=2 Tax=unclassified Methanosarcina TaxID=2644672 RepID=UPI00062193A0|nr:MULTISPECIES: hypothetical protein [unclassified Methanosarcina]KKG17038.1 hypothetical protein EO94_18290 [Methanosarcina sp. 2.H.T.1A.3]KKG20338.1 hypothetical protein EO98_18600 [Methanosarcina sp. 2.H.T.1A.6]KKG23397.1 hypothetical protein EO96_17255 [Methanosarcina sp. 2.H.T.1A.8]KKG27689.1 hypothetical protein EO97_19970 [Methanosarcina sp. 2.H.T.1A.15]
MYNQSEFGNLENYLLEKKYSENTSCEQNPDVHIFTGTVEYKKHRFKSVSLFLINTFDEKILEIMSKILVFLCITIALVTTINFLDNETLDWFYILGIMVSLVPLIISLCIQNVLEYHKDTFCRKCGNKLACEEIGEPVMKEKSNFEDYTLTVMRHWKCRYCGNVDSREGPENIFAEKGEMLPVIYLKGIECKKCSMIGTVEEFKKPDIKEIGNKRIIRRYYKCTLCGHEDISEIEKTINHSIYAHGS